MPKLDIDSNNYMPVVTKTLRAFLARNADKVSEFYAEADGIFIHLKEGWCDAHGSHTIRGDHSSHAIERFKRTVRKEVG